MTTTRRRSTSTSDRAAASRLLGALEQRTEQLALINGVLRTIVSGAPLTDILRVFASNLKTLCPFDRCSISIYDERRRVFHVPYMVMGGKVQETKEAPRPFGSSVLTKVIETRQPVLRRNIEADRRAYENDREFRKKGFASEMIFPLQVSERPFGTFNIGAFEAERLDESHLRAIQEIIPAIAVAVWQHLSRERFIFV